MISRKQLLKMQPGKELDRLIYREVIGEDDSNPPPYSTSIGSLAGTMFRNGWLIRWDKRIKPGYKVGFVNRNYPDISVWSPICATYAHAVCLASLLAVICEEEYLEVMGRTIMSARIPHCKTIAETGVHNVNIKIGDFVRTTFIPNEGRAKRKVIAISSDPLGVRIIHTKTPNGNDGKGDDIVYTQIPPLPAENFVLVAATAEAGFDFGEVMRIVGGTTREKGFNTQDHVTQLLLMADEVKEALEHIGTKPVINEKQEQVLNVTSSFMQQMEYLKRIRKDKTTEYIPVESSILDKTALAEELADIVIRVMSYADGNELPLAEAILAKAEKNRARPVLHGGNSF